MSGTHRKGSYQWEWTELAKLRFHGIINIALIFSWGKKKKKKRGLWQEIGDIFYSLILANLGDNLEYGNDPIFI